MLHKNSMHIFCPIKKPINFNDLAAVLDQAEFKYTVTRYHIHPY